MRRRVEEEEPKDRAKFELPLDDVVEQVIVAAAVVSREARSTLVKLLPRVEHFHHPQFRAAWFGLLELEKRQLDYDGAAMSRLVGDRVDLEYLAKLAAMRPTPPDDLGHYVGLLLWDGARVAAVEPYADLGAALKDPATPQEKTKSLVRRLLLALDSGGSVGRGFADPEELVRRQAEEIRRRVEDEEGVYPFGVRWLDYYEDGYANEHTGQELGGTPRLGFGSKPGKMTVVTAMSADGKTTVAYQIALGLAQQGRRGIYFGWEPSCGDVVEQLATISMASTEQWKRSTRSRFSQGSRAREPVTPEEREEHRRRMSGIAKIVRFGRKQNWRSIAGKYKQNDRILDYVRQEIASTGADWVIFDLFARCLVDRSPDAFSVALEELYEMGEEGGFHSVLLAQQLQKGEFVRKDHRPTLSGIKDTSAYNEVGDLIIGAYRPGRWKPGIADDTIEVEIFKNRGSQNTFAIECDCDMDRGYIHNGRTIPSPSMSSGAGDESGLGEFLAPQLGGKKQRRKRDD